MKILQGFSEWKADILEYTEKKGDLLLPVKPCWVGHSPHSCKEASNETGEVVLISNL